MEEDDFATRPYVYVERIEDIWGNRKLLRKFICRLCEESCHQHREFSRHIFVSHTCPICYKVYKDVNMHLCQPLQLGAGHPDAVAINPGTFTVTEDMYNGTMVHYQKMFNDILIGSVSQAFDYTFSDMQQILKNSLQNHKNVRTSLLFYVTLDHPTKGSDKKVSLFTPYIRLFHQDYILSTLMSFSDYIITSLEVYTDGESGYSVSSYRGIELRVAKYKPYRGNGYIPIPKCLSARHFLNPRTPVGCFKHCVFMGLRKQFIGLPSKPDTPYAELNPNERKQLKRWHESSDCMLFCNVFRSELFDGENYLNFEGCTEDVDFNSIKFFELLNQDISVTVFGQEGKSVFVIRPAPEIRKNHVNLLMLQKPVFDNTQLPSNSSDLQFDTHYALILNASSLLGQGHHGQTSTTCPYCFNNFKKSYDDHIKICAMKGGARKISFPKSTKYEFKKLKAYEEIPFKIYFSFQYYHDFENNSPPENNGLSQSDLFYTEKYSNLEVAAYSLCVVGPVNKTKNKLIKGDIFQESYSGENVIDRFICRIHEISNEIDKMISEISQPINITHAQKLEHMLALTCPICRKPFDSDLKRAADHDHITSHYRQTMCVPCNGQIQLQRTPVVIGLGIAGRELHSILLSLKSEHAESTKVILKNSEQIMSLTINSIRFLDFSYFLNNDLSDLIKRQWAGVCLSQFHEKFPLLYDMYANIKEHLPHFIRGVWFPAPFLISKESLDFNEQIPADYYYCPITLEQANSTEYALATEWYQKAGCNTYRDMLHLHLNTKILCLADIVTSFINFAQAQFKLCPLHYVTLSSYSWDIMGITLTDPFEYCKDLDIISIAQANIRGGPCGSVCRLLEAKNERLRTLKNENPKNRSHILVVDENAQYPHKGLQSLPHSEYQFCDTLTVNDILNYHEDDDYGFIIIASLEYPKIVAKKSLDLPYLPSRRQVRASELSTIQQESFRELREHTEASYHESREKVIMDVSDKVDYVVEIDTLKYYLSRGIRLKSIKTAIKYRQKPWLREFFTLLFELRMKAKLNRDEIGYLLIKGIMNRCIGTMMGNTAKHHKVEICKSPADAINFISKHHFMDYKILNKREGVTLFMFQKGTVYYNKNLLATFKILDQAKKSLYSFWDQLTTVFPGTKLGYLDTDGICCLIPDPNDNYFQKLEKIKILDFSGLNPQHSSYSNSNAGKPGFFKIEELDAIEVVSLRGKAYSIKRFCYNCNSSADPDCFCSNKKRMSAVPNHVIKNLLTHEFYKQSLFADEPKFIECNTVQAKGHKLSVVTRKITAFGSLNTSRYLLPDKINTYPFGYLPDLLPISFKNGEIAIPN